MFYKLKDKLNTAGNDAMEKHIGTVQGLAKEHIGPKLNEIGNDEVKMNKAFQMLYLVVPAPVRLVVSEEKFVTFCMANRHRILESKAA